MSDISPLQGWKLVEAAMRKRQEEEAWEALARVTDDELADKQLQELWHAPRQRKRTRR